MSGRVRDAFIRRGCDAWSCDLLPTIKPGPHYQCDVRLILDRQWDIGIFHPDCTYLCSSGLHWNKRVSGRQEKTEQALEFVRLLMAAPIHRIAIENPVGCISTRIRPFDQKIQPYEYGDDASKQTCLWLKNLPLLKPTKYVEPRWVDGKPRWGNQTDSGQNRLGPSEDRAMLRSLTYPGIARAFAAAWYNLEAH